jgi:hypothetical protein
MTNRFSVPAIVPEVPFSHLLEILSSNHVVGTDSDEWLW